MSENAEGQLPRGGFAQFKPELHVTDIDQSLAFWTEVVGFTVAYARVSEKFAYLEHAHGAQMMLCQRNGKWETGPMQPPFGQGVMFQLEVDDLDGVLATIKAKGITPYSPLREVWRKTGNVMGGQREIFLQDPDGYLIMIEQGMGDRPL